MNPLTQQGIVALKAGNKAEARRCLKLALQQNEKDVAAWLWLSGAVEQERERLYCLKMVLNLDPQNELAQRGLAAIAAKGQAAKPPASGSVAPFTTSQPPAPKTNASPTTSQPPAPRPIASPTTQPPPAAAYDQPFTFDSILNQNANKPAPPAAPSTASQPPAPKTNAPFTTSQSPAPHPFASTTPSQPPAPLFSDLPTWYSEDDADPAESAAGELSSAAVDTFGPAAKTTWGQSQEPAQADLASWRTQAAPAQSAAPVSATAPKTALVETQAASNSNGSAGSKKPSKPQPRGGFKPWMWWVLGGLALLLCTMFGGIALLLSTPSTASGQPDSAAGLQATIDLELNATDFPTPTPSFTPTPRPTRTPTATPTFMVLGPTIVGQMQDIQREVADLRGLPLPDTEVPSYVVTKAEAADLLRNLYVNDAMRAELENTKRALVIFGMVKPTYDLVNISLNHLVDNIGGFYLPDSKRIFVLAVYRFGGIEHFIYSHEFDHAVVDKAYNISKMQQCPGDDQRCAAMDALIEGDASLLMRQWVKQYATPLDYRDFLAYKPPAFALSSELPEEFPPDALVLDSNFPYEQGLAFVTELYNHGNWAEVNQAYANPPSSTEQILHPAKYFAGEGPALMTVPQIETVLGSDWQVIDSNSLGEWYTYLILGFGADKAAQLDAATAQAAAAGWGGDHYQVYYNAAQNQTAMAAHWVWDSDADGEQFAAALKKVLNERFRANTLDQPGASCWQMNGETTCLVSRGNHTLWLSAPTLDLINTMWAQYPEMQ